MGNPSKPSPFSSTNYLVFDLGPMVSGKYDYALVSDPNKASLYVLVRDVSRFRDQYEADVLARLTALGFTSTVNKPLAARLLLTVAMLSAAHGLVQILVSILRSFAVVTSWTMPLCFHGPSPSFFMRIAAARR